MKTVPVFGPWLYLTKKLKNYFCYSFSTWTINNCLFNDNNQKHLDLEKRVSQFSDVVMLFGYTIYKFISPSKKDNRFLFLSNLDFGENSKILFFNVVFSSEETSFWPPSGVYISVNLTHITHYNLCWTSVLAATNVLHLWTLLLWDMGTPHCC